MNKFSKSLMLAGAAAIGLSAMGAGAIHAASSTTSTDPMSSLVQAIASKFNLSTTDVQAVFDTQKATMDAQRQADQKTRLDQAVTDGKITQAQEDLIVAKQAEEQTFQDSLKSMSQTDRDTAMKAHMTALQKWATDNSIPQQYLMMGHGGPGGGHGGPGGDFGGGTPPTGTPSSTTPAS
jgi:hypothetical protein